MSCFFYNFCSSDFVCFSFFPSFASIMMIVIVWCLRIEVSKKWKALYYKEVLQKESRKYVHHKKRVWRTVEANTSLSVWHLLPHCIHCNFHNPHHMDSSFEYNANLLFKLRDFLAFKTRYSDNIDTCDSEWSFRLASCQKKSSCAFVSLFFCVCVHFLLLLNNCFVACFRWLKERTNNTIPAPQRITISWVHYFPSNCCRLFICCFFFTTRDPKKCKHRISR